MTGFITCILQQIIMVKSTWMRQEDVWDVGWN